MDLFDDHLARIEASLLSCLPQSIDAAWLSRVAGQDCPDANPIWADRFLEPGRELLRRGGKRWRPLVSLLTCEALGGERAADALVPLVEILHNGSLIVDDIEDSSSTRRGGAAIHEIFGIDLAVNMGNFMYFLPTLVLFQTSLGEAMEALITRDWLLVLRRLHLGQGYDILWHKEALLFPDEKSYLTMCRFKTSALAAFAGTLGARAAQTASPHKKKNSDFPQIDDKLIDALAKVWENLGLGFQILDDVRNLSPSGVWGKDRGDDIVEGKKSLPVILHAAKNPHDIPYLSSLFTKAAQEAPQGNWESVEAMIDLLIHSQALEEARQRGKNLLNTGRQALKELLPENKSQELLLALVDSFSKEKTPLLPQVKE